MKGQNPTTAPNDSTSRCEENFFEKFASGSPFDEQPDDDDVEDVMDDVGSVSGNVLDDDDDGDDIEEEEDDWLWW